MHILIAPDSFKESCTAHDVAEALATGISLGYPEAQITKIPLADGGEGTLNAIKEGKQKIIVSTFNALNEAVEAYYLIENNIAYIEMAQASGLELIPEEARNILRSNTYGTGVLIKDALQKGIKEIVLFVGGSATNDAGIGMAGALGFVFKDKNNIALEPIAQNLNDIALIEKPDFDFYKISLKVATDVQNPLYGNQGAAYVYAKQKGASNTEIEILDKGLENIAQIFKNQFQIDVQEIPGAGAAGGIGAGAVVFLGAEIIQGAKFIFEHIKLEKYIESADLIITGEGKIDSQTSNNKLIDQLLNLAKTKKVIVLGGGILASKYLLDMPNVIYASSIINTPMSLIEAKQNVKELLIEKGAFIGKFLKNMK